MVVRAGSVFPHRAGLLMITQFGLVPSLRASESMSETEQAISIDDRGRELIRGAIDETMIQVVDALFRHFAQQVGPQTGFSIEKATAGLWGLFERGDLRLVASDDGGLTVETCGENRAERRVQARKNRRLVEFKRQMAREGAEVAATSK